MGGAHKVPGLVGGRCQPSDIKNRSAVFKRVNLRPNVRTGGVAGVALRGNFLNIVVTVPCYGSSPITEVVRLTIEGHR